MIFKVYSLKIGCEVIIMPNYQRLYTMLFNAITDAIVLMRQMRPGAAAHLLIQAQKKAEEAYISDDGSA